MTTERKQLRPFIAIPPGEILREELEARGWTQAEFAEILGKPVQTICEIVNGKKSITPETAVLFSESLGTSAEFWLNLESAYRLDLLSKEKENHDSFVERKAKLFSTAPISEMIKFGWIDCKKKRGRYTETHIEKIEAELLKFFNTKSLDEIRPLSARYRKSSEDEATNTALHAWLTQARNSARKIKAKRYERKRFKAAIEDFVQLSAQQTELSLIQKELAELGVRLAHIPHLSRTKLDGAAFWVDSESPAIVITLRINRVDNFWFTLMHEIAHILLSHVKPNDNPILDEDVTEPTGDKNEMEADQQAQDWLIPPTLFERYLEERNGYFTTQSVRRFAEELLIHPAIVVGRLQHERMVPYSHMRNVLERFH